MASIALSSSLVPRHVVVVLRGELDVTDAMLFARALSDAATDLPSELFGTVWPSLQFALMAI